ncbi:MAG: hypothetical protein EBR82_15355 [Caulobacteraceae bacterium]|nr:hypothetical protein [Caulobacteraceae bacterium]
MSKKPARNPDGTVGKGNTLGQSTRFGPGNDASKGHGRPPDRVKQALNEILDSVDEKDPTPLSIEAVQTLRLAIRSRDERGNPTTAAVVAASKIMEHRWGKARQTTEISISAINTIETVRKVLVGIVAADAREAMLPPATPSPKA